MEDSLYDVILGRDFLSTFLSRIDFRTNTLELSCSPLFSHLGHSDPLELPSCSVFCPRSCVLPPHSESVIPARLKDKPLEGFVGVFEPSLGITHRYELYGAAALVVVAANGVIPVRLLNPTAIPIPTYRHSTLGTFQPEDKDVLAISLNTGDPQVSQAMPSSKELEDCINLSVADLTEYQKQRFLILAT